MPIPTSNDATSGCGPLISGLFLLVCAVFLFQYDARLKIWGVKTTAIVYQDTGPRTGRRSSRYITYDFRDETGAAFQTDAAVANSFEIPADKKIDIIYMRDEPKSARMASKVGFFGPLVFFGVGFLLTIVGAVRFLKP